MLAIFVIFAIFFLIMGLISAKVFLLGLLAVILIAVFTRDKWSNRQ